MPSDSLPPLSAIRCFEAAARHRNFTRAGDELGLTQAAVSWQIRALEDRLGAPLFVRGPRGVELTGLGASLLPRVTGAFAELRAAFEDAGRSVGGTLVIDCVATFAMSWLAARIGAFQLRHPDLAVRLQTNARLVDFGRDAVDVAIRSGDGRWPGLVVHPLFEVTFAPMASPRLLAAHPVARPEDILALPLIDRRDPWWTQWFEDLGIDASEVPRRTGLAVETQALAARAAIAGQGVAMLTPPFFRTEIETGLLVQPFPHVGRRGSHYHLVYPESRRQAPKVRAFRDWLLAEVRAAPPGAGGDE